MKGRLDVLDLDRIRTLVGVGQADEWQEVGAGVDSYAQVYCQALDEGATEDQAHEAALEAEEEAQDEYQRQQVAALASAAGELLAGFKLDLVELGQGFWQVVPAENWQAAAREVCGTLTGYGFALDSPAELLERGPYQNYRQAVLCHLEWARERATVYGTATGEQLFERALGVC